MSLTSADIADAVVTSANQLLVNGKMPGTISMYVWERSGGLHRYEIVVQRDLARLNEQMARLFPGEHIEAQSSGKGIVLSGLVSSKEIVDRASSVAVRTEIAGGLGPAQANPEQLQRVLFNLLQNAVRHTPADGSVVVRAEPVAGTVEIEVADTGTGIPVDQRERIFDAFVRGDDARSGEGAGLGLAIARAIVEAHGGRIWIVDAPVGTSVRFSLPAAA